MAAAAFTIAVIFGVSAGVAWLAEQIDRARVRRDRNLERLRLREQARREMDNLHDRRRPW